MKLYPIMETPQITSHPEHYSQCNGKASASEHRPTQWNISYHNDMLGLCESQRDCTSSDLEITSIVLSSPIPLLTSLPHHIMNKSQSRNDAYLILIINIFNSISPRRWFQLNSIENREGKPQHS